MPRALEVEATPGATVDATAGTVSWVVCVSVTGDATCAPGMSAAVSATLTATSSTSSTTPVLAWCITDTPGACCTARICPPATRSATVPGAAAGTAPTSPAARSRELPSTYAPERSSMATGSTAIASKPSKLAALPNPPPDAGASSTTTPAAASSSTSAAAPPASTRPPTAPPSLP